MVWGRGFWFLSFRASGCDSCAVFWVVLSLVGAEPILKRDGLRNYLRDQESRMSLDKLRTWDWCKP